MEHDYRHSRRPRQARRPQRGDVPHPVLDLAGTDHPGARLGPDAAGLVRVPGTVLCRIAFIPAIFATVVFIYGGWIFIAGALRELGDRAPGMMTLIGLAISVAFLYSAAVTLGFDGHPLWWELATLVTIMLLGHWIEMRSIFQAQGALKELAKLLPDTALRLKDGDETEEVPVDQLGDGDLILIRPGAGIPADGAVRSGKSSVNEAMITGESRAGRKA
jgi:P-type Cu2+ transporter